MLFVKPRNQLVGSDGSSSDMHPSLTPLLSWKMSLLVRDILIDIIQYPYETI